MAKENKTIGRVPVSRHEYTDGATYYKDNIVTRYGSAFQCVVEATTTPPATIDASGKVTLGEGWIFFADATASKNAETDIENLKSSRTTDVRVIAEALVSLAARISALEGGKPYLGDATAGTLDVSEITKCRYPMILFGHGVPAEATKPTNLPEGLPWDGLPMFKGQQYINLDAPSGGLYYAVGVDSVNDWKQA